MSLYRWFIPQRPPTTRKPYLPDSSKDASQKDALEVEAANQCVEEELGRKRRGTYNYYDPELRAKIGKYAATSGNKAAVNNVSEIKPDLRTSTVKPIHARWLMEVHSKLSKNSDVIISGFEKAGIKDFIVAP